MVIKRKFYTLNNGNKIVDKKFYTLNNGNKILEVARGVNFKVGCYLGPGSQWYSETGLPSNIESKKWYKNGMEFSKLAGHDIQLNNAKLYVCNLKIDHILTVVGENFKCG